MFVSVCASILQSPTAHEEMVEGLMLESKLRARIAELQQHRQHGLRTLAQAEVWCNLCFFYFEMFSNLIPVSGFGNVFDREAV